MGLGLPSPAGEVAASLSPIADFIRRRRDAILERWYASMKDRPIAHGLSREQLLNHVPELLEAIASAEDARAVDPRVRLATASAEAHALERLGDGFDLRHVVIELAVLRDCVLDTWVADALPLGRDEIRFLNRSMDRAMAAAVERYGAARDRTLVALDKVAAAAAGSRDVDELLQKLLDVLVATMPAVESGAVLLREGAALVARATSGEYTRSRGLRVPIEGRSLAARVAATGAAVHSTGAEEALQPATLATPPQVLFALPLVENRVTIGVIELRSMPGSVFSGADERLFGALAARASTSILQHMLRDTAERRAAELDGVLKSVPDAILVTERGRIRLLNPAARELFGLDSEPTDAYGWLTRAEPRPLHGEAQLLPGEWPVVIAERTARPHVADLVLRHGASGKDVIVRMLAAPVRHDRSAGAVVVVCTDITDRRRIEAEREELVKALQETLQDREHVLAVVAHDLRSPLTTMGLAAHALAIAGPDSDIGRRSVGTIERSTQRMDRLIQDLLDASSIRAGRLALDLRLHQPELVVADVAESFSVRAAEAGVEVRIDVADRLPRVRADHERLVQALSNLVGNALKVCRRGGSVVLSVARIDGDVVFSVTDNGPGIDAELRDAIFEPFRRGTNRYSGTGLGLAISRGIAEGHGGRIWVESEKGSGATFRIAIPVAEPQVAS